MSRGDYKQLICSAIDIPRLTVEHFDKIGKEKQKRLTERRTFHDGITKPIVKYQHNAILALKTRDAILASRDAFVSYVRYQQDCFNIERAYANEKLEAFGRLKCKWDSIGELYEFLLQVTEEDNFTAYMEEIRKREVAQALLELK